MDFSIVIPHKNSSKLLRRLLETIPFKDNIQVIVVDDNSTSEEYASLVKLNNLFDFQLYKNKGKFAGGARNTGISHAKGKWLVFADADDFFTDNFLAILNKYLNSDVDLVYCNVTSCYSDTLEPAYRDQHIRTIAKKYKESGEEGNLRCCYSVPWGKIVRHSLVKENKILYDEVPAGNDIMFSVKTGINALKICWEDLPIYCSTVASNSITTTLRKESFESKFQATLRLNDYLRENNYGKFQASVLFFLGKSIQFGIGYTIHVFHQCMKHHSNLFIGFSKIFNYKEVANKRQNKTYIAKTENNKIK